jgi:ion channel
MLSKLFVAWCLLALCVVVHAGGVTYVLRWLRRQPEGPSSFQHWMWLFIRVASWIVVLHLFEIGLWAVLYAAAGAMPDLQTSFYFSTVTYTTTGYGDLVLSDTWRVVGGIEALTGILMCGWSTAFFFAVVSSMYQARPTGPRDVH